MPPEYAGSTGRNGEEDRTIYYQHNGLFRPVTGAEVRANERDPVFVPNCSEP
jgi:hypothetical protein